MNHYKTIRKNISRLTVEIGWPKLDNKNEKINLNGYITNSSIYN